MTSCSSISFWEFSLKIRTTQQVPVQSSFECGLINDCTSKNGRGLGNQRQNGRRMEVPTRIYEWFGPNLPMNDEKGAMVWEGCMSGSIRILA